MTIGSRAEAYAPDVARDENVPPKRADFFKSQTGEKLILKN